MTRRPGGHQAVWRGQEMAFSLPTFDPADPPDGDAVHLPEGAGGRQRRRRRRGPARARRADRHQVALTLDLAPGLPLALGDRVQLQQVLLNLIMAGVEAVAALADRLRHLHIRSARHDADHVAVAVRDTGPGIDPGTLDRLFTAFFTTKPGGMGMGLSISRSIIEAH